MSKSLLAVIALLLLAACSKERIADSLADTVAPSVRIVRPAANDWVADSVTVQVEAQDAGGISHIALLADDRTVALRFEPAWAFAWNTEGLADSSVHLLHAVAADAAGNSAVSDACPVLVRSNEPPLVRMLWPRDGAWVDLDRPFAPWCCLAADPEEGPLDGASVRWSIDGREFERRGSAITPASTDLSAGAHRVRVEARDEWNTRASAECLVVAFRYPGRASPEDALTTLFSALQAADSTMIASAFAEEFRLRPAMDLQGANEPVAGDAFATCALVEAEAFRSLAISASLSAAQSTTWQGREYASLELRALAYRLIVACPSRNDSNPELELAYVASNSRARLIFVRNAGSTDPWLLVTWWDLHGASWSSSSGPAWSELIARARDGRLCR